MKGIVLLQVTSPATIDNFSPLPFLILAGAALLGAVILLILKMRKK